jgi:hypothetical protein
MTGVWDPSSLGQIRDLVAAGRVPRLSRLAGRGMLNLQAASQIWGHVAFEFIEAEYGKTGVGQFLVEVRRNVVNGAADPYQAALSRTPAEFDSAFARYLRERFSP